METETNKKSEPFLPTYASKYDNYNIAQRLDDLRTIVEIQCSKGNYDVNEYMRGMANGLLLAWNTIAEPYGKEVPFIGPHDTEKK